jgi:hypothetical protein
VNNHSFFTAYRAYRAYRTTPPSYLNNRGRS